ncbi:MAG: hypothetical protein NZ828_00865 [Alphaproteobacteria bacterium]|nr:hypothetical protein [Alphaproteobacteria bacterium]
MSKTKTRAAYRLINEKTNIFLDPRGEIIITTPFPHGAEIYTNLASY